jgi:murein L,D-transpeptidase YcbB/YkuD
MSANMKSVIEPRRVCVGVIALLAAAMLWTQLSARPVRAEISDTDAASRPAENPAPHAAPENSSRQQDLEPDQSDQRIKESQRSPAASADHAPELSPETVKNTLEASKRYEQIAAEGGWPHVLKSVRSSSKGKAVVALRKRLAAEGYLPQDESSDWRWDDGLTQAVRQYQGNVGLPQTGVVSDATSRELNVTAQVRSRQLAATAERLQHLRFRFAPRYVEVNIPAATVEAVENGQVVGRYTAVVGGRHHPSPQIKARIISIDLNPKWTVPVSIVKKELMPKLKRDPNYLAREEIRIFDGRGHEIDPRKLRRTSIEHAAKFTFRQDPGAKNSLGFLRISMPNSQEVYMHDTPKKRLFDRSYRFLSHGCVRVERVYDLASWLLQGSPGAPSGQWDEASLLKKLDQTDESETRRIPLRRPVPVVWAYMTGWASPDGAVHFRPDIYHLDRMSAGKRLR